MMRWICLALLCATPLGAETLIATRTIPARSLITAQDVALVTGDTAGALRDPQAAIGMETRQALYPNRPITQADIGPPAIIARNQIVPLRFRVNGLTILTEGRALDRGAAGEVVRIMNLASRNVVTARITPDAIAEVSE